MGYLHPCPGGKSLLRHLVLQGNSLTQPWAPPPAAPGALCCSWRSHCWHRSPYVHHSWTQCGHGRQGWCCTQEQFCCQGQSLALSFMPQWAGCLAYGCSQETGSALLKLQALTCCMAAAPHSVPLPCGGVGNWIMYRGYLCSGGTVWVWP